MIPAVMFLLSANIVDAGEENFIIVASTTPTQNSGLFDHLLPEFHAATGIEARVVALGTGAALAYGKRCDAQVFIEWLVSEPGQEAIARFRLSGQPLFIPDRLRD